MKSTHQSSSGPEAVKSRWTRSAGRCAAAVGDGRPPRLAAPFGALDAVCAHQPLDPAAADLLAGAHERLPHPPGAVGEVVARVDLPDQLEQPLVLDPAGRPLAARSLVVRGRRHAQGPADRLDPEADALLVDERAHLGRCGSSSPAKNTACGLQDLVRPAQLGHLTPQLPDLLTLLAASADPGRRPSFASTCRRYFRSVSDGNPRSAATCAIGRPDSNTSRVARSNNSTGYFLALGITDLLPAGQTPYHRSLRQTRDGSDRRVARDSSWSEMSGIE